MLWTIGDPRANRRIDSWKEIASFFRRDERTVKRWEKSKFLPVHRIPGGERGGVFAYTDELTEWLNTPLPAKTIPQFKADHSQLEAFAVRPVEVKLSSFARGKLVARKSNGTPARKPMTIAKPAEMVAGAERSCSIYKKRCSRGKVRYSLVRQVELFGWSAAWNRGGWLPHLLQQHLKPGSAETGPAWHVTCDEIRKALGAAAEDRLEGSALIIEIRPNKATVLLCEIMELWGYSSDGWTSMMLRLKRLASVNPEATDAHCFSVSQHHHDASQSILMITCTPDGSIQEGKVIGKWPQPAAGLMNSALLCPAGFGYFAHASKRPWLQASRQEGLAMNQVGPR